MNWYLAKMVYRIHCGNYNNNSQFEEQLRLISSDSAAEAFSKAQEMGRSESTADGLMSSVVQWKFINVSEIYQINQFIDGAEIFSSLKAEENGTLYELMTNKRAELLRQNIEQHILDIY
ncbi:DUF4288 domain-containing protein [Pollutibacter soli]|uniref:DUF4288 domain-containing protein n=1 Tax=Pollutibacter soli TaxID=3034157 RepID=UPI003013749F